MKDNGKIGFLIISPGWAGAENVVKNIAKNLSGLNKRVVIYCNDEIYCHYYNLEDVTVKNIGVLNMESKKRYLNYISMYFSLRKFLRKEKLRILFLNLEGSLLVAHGLNRTHKILLPVVLHGDEINNFLNHPNEKLKNFFLSRYLKSSKNIISVGRGQIQNLSKKYKAKTVIIPNGVDSKVFKPSNNIKQKKNVILFAGRFIDIKGIREIISVAKQLPRYEFWFAGQGELNDLIVGKNVKNLGFKTTEELVKLYNQATICIFPSYRESFGLTGLEAMSCGRAIIATPLGFSEYIDDKKDGIIIPAKDEKALKNAIVDLMTNEKKRKMLEKNARKKALKYSWDKIAEKYLEVFREVIADGEKEK